jgi:hypothetical protein
MGVSHRLLWREFGVLALRRRGDVERDEITATLNRLGREGWELVSAFATTDVRAETRMVVCILKRPISG